MSLATLIAFVVLAVVAVFGGFRMLVSRHPVHSALYLVLSLVATAAIYLLLAAPFVAVVQVAVYAGAIMVLFVFVMMFLNLGPAQDVHDQRQRRIVTFAAAGLLGLLIWLGAIWRPGAAVTVGGGALPGYKVEEIGVNMLGRYALPFETASLLLLVAMVGVVVIVRPLLAAERRQAAAGETGASTAEAAATAAGLVVESTEPGEEVGH